MKAPINKVQNVREIQAKLEFLVLRDRLTSKETTVIDAILAGYSDVQALKKAGISFTDEKEAKKIVRKILSQAKVRQYLTAIDELYRYLAPKAISTIYKLMTESQSEAIRLQAAKEILDKIPESKKGASLPVQVKVNILNYQKKEK